MYMNMWCWVCENYRTHRIIENTELARCISCGSRNWVSQGEGGN